MKWRAVQEVDEFKSFWEPELKARGYSALYKQRTQVSGSKKDGACVATPHRPPCVLSRSPPHRTAGGANCCTGSAIFFKSNKCVHLGVQHTVGTDTPAHLGVRGVRDR